MRLYIAEKPSVAKALAGCLAGPRTNKQGYIETSEGVVTWLFGHVLQQVEPADYDPKYQKWHVEDLPITPKKWLLKVSPSAEKQFKVIKELVGKASEVIHAGDPDREGQLLVDEVLDYLGNQKPVRRILPNSLDDKNLKRILADERDNKDFLPMKLSALARSRADWLIGMNMTRKTTLDAQAAGNEGVLSVGRVQTPVVALVVRREREIQGFKPADYFTFTATFAHENGELKAEWKARDSQIGLDDAGRLIDKTVSDALLKRFKAAKAGKVVKHETTQKSEAQRLLFSLSALQVAAGKRYGYKPQQVLDAAQALYEKKLTTYPRSDCEYLPVAQLEDAGTIIANLQAQSLSNDLATWAGNADPGIKSRAWNDEKISAHHAIIPTVTPVPDNLSDTEKNLYYLIAQAYLAQFYSSHTYYATTAEIEFANEEWHATGKTVIEEGWKILYKATDKEPEDADQDGNDGSGLLPAMATEDPVQIAVVAPKTKTTKPPKRFSQHSIIQAMKEIHKYTKNQELKSQLKAVEGIGTEATRAPIITQLIARNLLAEKDKFLVPTVAASLLVDVLPDDMTYPDTTAIWEHSLKAIKSQAQFDNFVAHQVQFVTYFCGKNFKDIIAKNIIPSSAGITCPVCGLGHLRLRSFQGNKFWSCSRYPECKTSYQDRNGKPETAKHKCPKCGGELRFIHGTKGDFWGCGNYKTGCKVAYSDYRGKPDFDGKKKAAKPKASSTRSTRRERRA